MSIVQVNKIQDTTGDDAMSFDSSGNTTVEKNLTVDGTTTLTGAVTLPNDTVTAPKTDLSIVQGDIIYGTGTDAWAKLAKGTADQVLTMNTGATAPEWAAAGGGLFSRGWYDKDSTESTITKSDGETRIGGNSGADLSITLTPTSTSCRYLVRAQFTYRKHTSSGQWGWRVQKKLSGGSWGPIGMMHASYGEEWNDSTFRTTNTQQVIFHPSTTTEMEFGLFCQVWGSHDIKIDANASIQDSSIMILEIPDTTNFSGI